MLITSKKVPKYWKGYCVAKFGTKKEANQFLKDSKNFHEAAGPRELQEEDCSLFGKTFNAVIRFEADKRKDKIEVMNLVELKAREAGAALFATFGG